MNPPNPEPAAPAAKTEPTQKEGEKAKWGDEVELEEQMQKLSTEEPSTSGGESGA